MVLEAFVPDLMAQAPPFRPGLSVKGSAHLGVFEMIWDNDGRTIFSTGKNQSSPAS